MKKQIIIMFFILILSSCSMFQKEIIEPKIELTPEQVEQIEKEKFEKLLEEENKQTKEYRGNQLQLEQEKIEKEYNKYRKNMTEEELIEETRLLNLNKMIITEVE